MTNDEFQTIIEKNPTLTTHGFGVDRGKEDSFFEERKNLCNHYNEALLSEEFLNKCKRTAKPHKSLGSTYSFKHKAEHYAHREKHLEMYIPEGALVLAAIHLGFKMKRKKDSTSVYLNISQKTRIHDRSIANYY
jgi:hypothetical protein